MKSASTLLCAIAWLIARNAGGAEVDVSSGDIGGVVTGVHGPEAGVWVIAETRDLPTRFAKIVVTDELGRFVIPQLPRARYQVWVRGYGLIDSARVESEPGKVLKLRAATAPSEKAAAEYYPGVYWYSMLEIPQARQFPGTGDRGNGIAETMQDQHYWIDSLKNGCQSCHALGSRGIRVIPGTFRKAGGSFAAWARRTQAGQAMEYMARILGRFGAEKALQLFANWTDRIAAGELPFARPDRPKGIERNVVVSVWDWSSPTHYLHDAISTDKRHPTVNANGLIWGSSEESTDLIPTLDPVKNIAATLRHPYSDPHTPSSTDLPHAESAYWGMEPIWDGHTSVHNLIMDASGRVWFTARIRPSADPDFCKAGSTHPSAKGVPLSESTRQLSMYDPTTSQWHLIDTCFTTHHLYFGSDADDTLWTSAGSPLSGVVGWLNTRVYLQTHDPAKAQGWTPLIVDANGNGQRDDYAPADEPLDPNKDKRVIAGFYGVMPSPADTSIWGQSMDVGLTGVDQPGTIVRLTPGSDPAKTALAEIYRPPEGGFGPRGIDVDLNGVVWTALSSGHLASFDRRLCHGPLNGPSAVSGEQCPEGWRLYRFPGPQFKGLSNRGSADHAYYVWVDRYDTLGLGPNVPIAMTNGGEALLALVDGKPVSLRVPYPMPFFTKNVDGRIDDPNAGWKGRGLWTTSGTRAPFHGEGGRGAYPKVYKIQMRPDPLAR
jgi:hypothetical protein